MKKLFIFALTAIGLLACNGKNDPKDPSNDSATITCNPTTKTVVVLGDELFTVTITSKTAWSATADKPWVTITPNSGQGDAFVTVKVAAGDNDESRVLFSNGNSSATLIINRKRGMLPGKFSVSASKQVHFSPGNLQYQASTQIWRFAGHQRDMIGLDNSNISDSYSGWIDLFGWGTGNNPTNKSTSDSDYSVFVDWGVNTISNGGNKANLWRTLTHYEWRYLFCTRTNAASLFGLGSVNGVNGTIILPDNWTTPQGVSFTPSTTQGLARQGTYYKDSNGGHFGDNTYSSEQWSVMEQNGAVFLPAAGYRTPGTGVILYVGSDGHYWSSPSHDYPNSDTYLQFNSNELYPTIFSRRDIGLSVRLVKDFE